MSKRSRERQLAKLAARRASERFRRERKRKAALSAAAVVVAILGGFLAWRTFFAEEEKPKQRTEDVARGTGERTGTVKPKPGPKEVACGGEVPKQAGKPKPQFDGPPPMSLIDGSTYVAVLETSCGTIEIELLSARAPETVNSFVFLAERGYFDGQRFHRIANSIDVLQGGDPKGTGKGGPGYAILDELTGGESYGPGVVAMANSGPDTGGSQFFIVTGDKGRGLDDQGSWAIFGKVTEGLNVAKRIQELPVEGETPTQAIYIERVTIDIR